MQRLGLYYANDFAVKGLVAELVDIYVRQAARSSYNTHASARISAFGTPGANILHVSMVNCVRYSAC